VCPSDCGVDDMLPTERCNTTTCEVECPADCNAACGGFETCNQGSCTCECVENATCGPGFVFDADACGCVCDTDALACDALHTADPDSCTCECNPTCEDTTCQALAPEGLTGSCPTVWPGTCECVVFNPGG
jgi:hypothetical protein